MLAGSLDIPAGRFARLRRLNLIAATLHAASAVLMVVLGNGFSLPVTTLDFAGPPGTPLSEATVIKAFSVRLALMTALFSLLSALFHLLVISPIGRSRYLSELSHGRNRFRWVEYSLSATLMILLIMQITNTNDLAALVGVAFANISMILFGWIMEVVNTPGRRVWWTPFWFGCIAGVGPWVAIGAYLAVNLSKGEGSPPGFVWGILITIFVLFNCFAVNQWLQYRGRGRWADYLHGERVYIWLSVIAKTVLAWQIFANILID